jgi:hypothetical protein
MPPTLTRISFAGLMVFRPSKDIFELGILRARLVGGGMPDHILQIKIYPDRSTGESPRTLDTVLESYVHAGDVSWSLDVKDAKGNLLRGVQANIGLPPDRHQPSSGNGNDFGWMINLESVEFHQGKLTRPTGKLKPVISLNYGKLDSSCKTEVIDVRKGRKKFRDDFGFIAGAAALSIDTSNGELLVLRTQKQQDILGLTPGVSYEIEILNTPLDSKDLPTGGHFHLYYQLLFSGVAHASQFSVQSHTPRTLPPDLCSRVHARDPEPFRCGGIVVNEGSGPLG